MWNKGNRDITLRNIKNFVVLDFIGNMGVSVYRDCIFNIQHRIGIINMLAYVIT